MTSWLSVNEMTEQGFLVDALEMPAYPIVMERITDEELASVGRIIKSLANARKDGDEAGYGVNAVAFHSGLFRCTGYPRLQQLIRLVIRSVGLRDDKALSYPFATPECAPPVGHRALRSRAGAGPGAGRE